MKQEATKINNLSLFDLDDYSLDRPTGDYDWENSELDRMYEQPPPKQRSPDDTRSILKICEWMRAQPNGGILDLPEIREQLNNLLPNLQPPVLREHFKSLLPNLENREQNGEQNGEQFKSLLPILKPPQQNREQNREQIKTDPTGSPLVQIDGDRQIVKVNGETYILNPTKSAKPINRLNGWLDIKPSANKRNLYLCLRWRDGTTQRSRHLGKVIPLDAA